MSEGRTIRGAWVVIALITLGVIAGVAEVIVTRARSAREPATVPATIIQSGGERSR